MIRQTMKISFHMNRSIMIILKETSKKTGSREMGEMIRYGEMKETIHCLVIVRMIFFMVGLETTG